MASKRKFPLVVRDSYSSFAADFSSSSSDEVEVTLRVKISKTVTLKAKASETIDNIKALIKQRENAAPAHFQDLFISGNQLKDGGKLSEYITVGNSNVNVDVICTESIKINVERVSNDGINSIGFEVKMNDTIGMVKTMIDTQVGTISDEYKLIFAGKQLQDDMTIEGSGLKNDSVLYMMLCPKDTLSLRIAMQCGGIEKITVKPLNTIFDLKVVLQRNIDMPINQWHLAYSGKALEDPKTVAYCGLKDDSLLHVMLPSVQILVRIRSREHVTVFIKLTDFVSSLKEQIFDKAGYPVKYQTLTFAGKVLADDLKIKTYGIQKGSTVHLSFNPASRMKKYNN
ncbi:unnamed protein product [Rhodiola kirilowii]